jgi:hypothetical protein
MTVTKTSLHIFITPEERHYITQLNGMVYHEPDNKDHQLALNNYLKMLAMKYNYEKDWLKVEIDPLSGEVFVNKDNCCDEHLKAVDVDIEE